MTLGIISIILWFLTINFVIVRNLLIQIRKLEEIALEQKALLTALFPYAKALTDSSRKLEAKVWSEADPEIGATIQMINETAEALERVTNRAARAWTEK